MTNPNEQHPPKGQRRGHATAATNLKAAAGFAATLAPLVAEILCTPAARNRSYSGFLAAQLNQKGIKTREGKAWHRMTARRLIQRLPVPYQVAIITYRMDGTPFDLQQAMS